MIKFTKAKRQLIKPRSSVKKSTTLQKLDAFLVQEEPEAVEFLYRDLSGMQNAVTYKELREAYMAGGISDAQFQTWQTQYAQVVDNDLKPKWEAAAAQAASEAKAKYPYFLYEPQTSASMEWIGQHSAELVTNLAQEQKQAINTMIAHASGYTAMTPDEAARMIRPTIGLTVPQSLANARYRESVKQAYLQAHPRAKLSTAERKASDAAAKYGAKQHRYRAQAIARTELAFGYNAGAFGATKDAQAQGYIGDCVKVWLTAYDRRVCPECEAMDGERANMEDDFSNGVLYPPAHPHCRCAVEYEEIEGTNLSPNFGGATISGEPLQIGPQIGRAGLPDPTAMPIKTESGYQISQMLGDMTVLPDSTNGVAIRSDGTMLEGMNMTGRRVKHTSGAEYYEISGKLTEDTWEAAVKNAKKHGYQSDIEFLQYNRQAGAFDTGDISMRLPGYKIVDAKGGAFEVYNDIANKKQYGMAGYFRVRVPVTGSAQKDGEAMERILDRSGLRALASNPTAADEQRMRKIRLAWQRDPEAYEKARHLTGAKQDAAIEKILKKHGITAERAAGLQAKEVFPGYTTLTDPQALTEYKKAGLTHIWAGVGDADSVVAICQSDGFSATNRRIATGMKKVGASPAEDMMTGGSSSVFTRMGADISKDYDRSYLGTRYRVIISPEVMERTDWYAYTYDNFGQAHYTEAAFRERLSPTDFIKQTKQHYNSGNEIMFREGISKDTFVGISCQSDRHRTELLDAFRSAGVTQMNGVDIEDFVTVTTKLSEDSKRGLMGLSYYDKNIPFS